MGYYSPSEVKEEKRQQIKKYLRKVKCARGVDLAAKFSLGSRQLSYYLRSLRCLTSYSHKREFYALPETAKFKEQRIWKCARTGALFTDLDSLKSLVDWHVRESKAGLTSRELSRITGVPVEYRIRFICRKQCLIRRKFDGKYVYFYRANEKIYRAQVAKRKSISTKETSEVESIIDSEVEELQRAFQIALALLNYPNKSGPFIVRMLRGKGYRVSVSELELFLTRPKTSLY